jgi:hypothetical protein
MSVYIPLVIAVLVIGFLSIGMDRRWQARKADKDSPEEDDTSEKSSRLGNLKDKVTGGKNQEELAKKFQAWAGSALTTKEKGLKSWIEDLSLEEAKVFAGQVDAFCADMNMDLAWLVDEKLDKDPQLEKAAKSIVISYCVACWEAMQAQNDFKVFTTYQSMIDKPSTKANQALSQKLFTELVKQDMAPAISPELFVASEKEKQAQVMESIQQAADSNQAKFNTIFKQVLEIVEEDSSKSKPLSARLFKWGKKSENGQTSDQVETEPVAAT